MKPYLKEIEKVGKIIVWRVDGTYIRNKMDVNFNNSGHHYTFKYIPKNELWIDKDFSKPDIHTNITDEKLLINQGLYEIGLFKQKYGWLEAVTKAYNQAKAERKLYNEMTEKEAYKNVYVKKLNKYSINDINVWVIRGKIVRDVFYTDFTEGGHHYVYNFVPKDEIWVDDGLNPDEFDYVIFHEAIERNLMKYDKLKYNDAHGVAIAYEGILRQTKTDPDRITMHEINRTK